MSPTIDVADEQDVGISADFDAFFRTYYRRVVRAEFLLTGELGLAEELAQEAMLKVLEPTSAAISGSIKVRPMPLVRIEILEGRPVPEKKRLLQAVHDALVEAFGIPDDDRTQRIFEHDPGNFEIPPGHSDKYMLVEIVAFPGRSTTAKRALYKAIVRNLGDIGVPAGDVFVVIQEPRMENWGIRGGRSADEVDLGYSLDV
ncbi:MAG: tautomerase family protein [Actinomycetota bacterium]